MRSRYIFSVLANRGLPLKDAWIFLDSTYSLSREIGDCLTCILYVFEEEGLALPSEFEFVVLARAGSFPTVRTGSFPLLHSPSRIYKLNRDIRVR